MEKRHILSIAAIGCGVLWLWAVFAFDKWGATWWGISIWVFAIVFALIFIGIAAGLSLFRIDDSTPAVVLCGLVLFVVLSLGEGVFINEPQLHQPPAHSTTSTLDDESHSSFFYYWHESTTSSSTSSTSHSNSKGAGYVLLLLLLIVLLIGSAIVPHFWVVAVFVGVVLLWCFVAKEWRRESSYPEGYE